jgi:hypothetical protein
MRLLFLLPLLSPLAPVAAEPEATKGLVVHEWGVFRVHEDAETANADARAEWDDLPRFMYGQVSGRDLPVNWGALEIRRRPIVFFHAPKAMSLRMKIDFPGGMPGVWWPGTRSPAALGNRRPPVGTALDWELFLKEPPPGRRPQHNELREVSRGHWVERMRDVKTDEVFSVFGDGPIDIDHEKFVFYDGVFPQGKWVRVTVEKDRVALFNRVPFPVHDVTVIDRRGEGPVRVARLPRLEANAEMKALEFASIDRKAFIAAATETLTRQLVEAGLYKDEASSMLAACGKDLLETDGVTVFYRVPQTEYERRLPMTLTPRPESVVRVGLVHHSHCEPDFADRVCELVRQLDNDEIDVREAAQKKLMAMGPSATIQLSKLRKTETSPEVLRRLDELLAKWDTKRAFPR